MWFVSLIPTNPLILLKSDCEQTVNNVKLDKRDIKPSTPFHAYENTRTHTVL